MAYEVVTTAGAAAIIRDGLEAMKDRIIANHTAAGQVATGRTAASITVDVQEDDEGVLGIVTAARHFAVLETGSRPWTNPHMKTGKNGNVWPSAPKWFIDTIADWAAAKGIDIGNPWAVATGIMLHGSRLYRDGGRDDIFTPEIESAVKTISDGLAGYFDTALVNSLLRG